MADIYEQYGIKADAPKNVKVLCLEMKRLQKLYSDWENALGSIDWWKDQNAAIKSREIWIRMNYLDRQMNEVRSYILMAWQNREPATLVGEIERNLFGPVNQNPTSPRNSVLSQQP